ncbi:alanine racemase C-terminal domain-containing protein, partial [Escherichia coli]|uniref:alanine racemase C-terminal domain-containing protein n=1 Tax=Escherichia coli TaxID=562 RepID=UPI00191C20CC
QGIAGVPVLSGCSRSGRPRQRARPASISAELANSAATLRHQGRTAHDWVRAGIMMYGGVPDFPEHDAAHWDLRPAMTLRSQVIGEQDLQPGDTVGYGSTFTAEQPMRIGIVACGYADGYPRHAPTGTPVLVDGQRSTTVGRVSMD